MSGPAFTQADYQANSQGVGLSPSSSSLVEKLRRDNKLEYNNPVARQVYGESTEIGNVDKSILKQINNNNNNGNNNQPKTPGKSGDYNGNTSKEPTPISEPELIRPTRKHASDSFSYEHPTEMLFDRKKVAIDVDYDIGKIQTRIGIEQMASQAYEVSQVSKLSRDIGVKVSALESLGVGKTLYHMQMGKVKRTRYNKKGKKKRTVSVNAPHFIKITRDHNSFDVEEYTAGEYNDRAEKRKAYDGGKVSAVGTGIEDFSFVDLLSFALVKHGVTNELLEKYKKGKATEDEVKTVAEGLNEMYELAYGQQQLEQLTIAQKIMQNEYRNFYNGEFTVYKFGESGKELQDKVAKAQKELIEKAYLKGKVATWNDFIKYLVRTYHSSYRSRSGKHTRKLVDRLRNYFNGKDYSVSIKKDRDLFTRNRENNEQPRYDVSDSNPTVQVPAIGVALSELQKRLFDLRAKKEAHAVVVVLERVITTQMGGAGGSGASGGGSLGGGFGGF